MRLKLVRDARGEHNYGQLFADDEFIGHTLEDRDRFLETYPEDKIDGDTAIPRGLYRISITFSNRFQRPMPLVHGVPGFDGVRIHGGNTEANTKGCPLLGARRTDAGIANCEPVNARLMALLEACEKRGEDVWLELV